LSAIVLPDVRCAFAMVCDNGAVAEDSWSIEKHCGETDEVGLRILCLLGNSLAELMSDGALMALRDAVMVFRSHAIFEGRASGP
jgi:hypothetical protein